MTDPVTTIFTFLQLGMFIKLFFLVLILFYFIFSAVVFRQISLMSKVLESSMSPLIQLVAVIQIFVAGILFFLALILA